MGRNSGSCAMTGKHNIFLIGHGSARPGRKHLSRLLDYPFLDSDHEIELRTAPISPLYSSARVKRIPASRTRSHRRAQRPAMHRAGHGGGAVLDAGTRAI